MHLFTSTCSIASSFAAPHACLPASLPRPSDLSSSILVCCMQPQLAHKTSLDGVDGAAQRHERPCASHVDLFRRAQHERRGRPWRLRLGRVEEEARTRAVDVCDSQARFVVERMANSMVVEVRRKCDEWRPRRRGRAVRWTDTCECMHTKEMEQHRRVG